MSPAEYVIYVFGGVRKTARAIGRSPTTVSKWPKPNNKKGSDGRVPGTAQAIVLEIAKKMKLDIKPEDLLYGRKVKKI